MKRLWIGVAVLLVLLAAGAGLSYGVVRLHDEIYRELSEAAQEVRRGDLDAALQRGEAARLIWQRWRHFSASLSDHEPLEEMDSLFEELSLYSDLELPVDYAAICLRLAELSRAVSESHSLTWWNFL